MMWLMWALGALLMLLGADSVRVCALRLMVRMGITARVRGAAALTLDALPCALLGALSSWAGMQGLAFGAAAGGALMAVCLAGGVLILRGGRKGFMLEARALCVAWALVAVSVSVMLLGGVPRAVGALLVALFGAFLWVYTRAPGEAQGTAEHSSPPSRPLVWALGLLVGLAAAAYGAALMMNMSRVLVWQARLDSRLLGLGMTAPLLCVPWLIRALRGMTLSDVISRAAACLTLALGCAALAGALPANSDVVAVEVALTLVGLAVGALPMRNGASRLRGAALLGIALGVIGVFALSFIR